MQRPVVQAMCAAMAALLLAGCGGSAGPSEAEVAYAGQANRAVELFAKRLRAVDDGFGSASTRAEDLAVLSELKATTDDVAARLGEIDAPAEDRAAHEQLISDVKRYGTVVQRARGRFASTDPRTVLRARNDLASDLKSVNDDLGRTIASLNKALQD